MIVLSANHAHIFLIVFNSLIPSLGTPQYTRIFSISIYVFIHESRADKHGKPADVHSRIAGDQVENKLDSQVDILIHWPILGRYVELSAHQNNYTANL